MIDRLLYKLGYKKKDIPCNNIICNIKNYLDSININKKSKLEKKVICLAKKISYKILNNNYNIHIHNFEKKWGKTDILEINMLFTKSKQIVDTNYNKLLNDTDKKNYEKELYLALQLDENQKSRDIRILLNILNKYCSFLNT